jgi:hypothetical protein
MMPLSLLQIRILALLNREGPLSDIQMRAHLHTSGLTEVVTATRDLGQHSLIRPTGSPLIVWQITLQGCEQLEIANSRMEVCSASVN